MEKDNTLKTYICKECGKKETIQAINEILVYKCTECFMKEIKKGQKDESV